MAQISTYGPMAALTGTEKFIGTQGSATLNGAPQTIKNFCFGQWSTADITQARATAALTNSTTPVTLTSPLSIVANNGLWCLPGWTFDGSPVAELVNIIGPSVLWGGKFTANLNWPFQVNAGANAQIWGAQFVAAGLPNPNSISILMNQSSQDTSIIGCRANLGGFAFLSNSPGDINGLALIGNFLNAGAAGGDGVELNAPTSNTNNVCTVGNVLSAVNGFGYGHARARNCTCVGNVVKSASFEAFHIEDGQWTTCIVGNAGQNLGHAGVWIQGSREGQSVGEGVVVCGNTFKAAASPVSVDAGLYLVDDGWAVYGNCLVGNRVRDFAQGIANAANDYIAQGNVIDGGALANSVGILQGGGAHQHGTNLCHNVDIFVATTYPGSVDRIVSDTVITSIMDVSDNIPNDLGNYIRGFAFPTVSRPVISGANTFDLFEIGRLCQGKLIVTGRINSSHDHFIYAADILWNNTALTVTNAVNNAFGVLTITASPALTVVGTQLRLTVQSTATATIDSIYVDFQGVWYKRL